MELADSYFVEPVSMLLAKLSERKSYWTLKIQTTWPLESLADLHWTLATFELGRPHELPVCDAHSLAASVYDQGVPL